MSKKALIWKKSIYLNGYRCRCGKVLFVQDDLVDDVLIGTVAEDEAIVVCPDCYDTVARITTVEKAEEENMMRCCS